MTKSTTKPNCIVCGKQLIGKQRKYCAEHNPSRSNRKVLAEIARIDGDDEKAEQYLSTRSPPQWDSLQLAWALSITTDLSKAARLAGLDNRPKKELQDLRREAEKNWKDIKDLKTEGFQRLGFSAIMRQYIICNIATDPATVKSAAEAAKKLGESLEKITTSVSPTFGDFVINYNVVALQPKSPDYETEREDD